MRTRELIAQLQAEDPTGDLECVVGCSDVYFVTREPMYYDGTPWLLTHDEALRGKSYSVIGLRYPYGGHKVRIVPMGIDDVLADHPDIPIECREERRAHVEDVRARVLAELNAEELSPNRTSIPERNGE